MDIYLIPDTQVRPRSNTDYLYSLAAHIAEVKPTYLIMLGDWYDMKSASYFDKGKKSHEIENFFEDIDSGNEAVTFFFDWLDKLWKGNRKKCKRIILRGNHEERIVKSFEFGDSDTREMIKRHPIDNSRWDKVVPFLKEHKIADCYFSHYFPNGGSGRPITTAKQLLTKKHKTCIAGHKQGFDYAEDLGPNERTIHGLIVGSCYTHDEGYIGPNNYHFRGSVVLRNVSKGTFDIERFSLKHLMQRFK